MHDLAYCAKIGESRGHLSSTYEQWGLTLVNQCLNILIDRMYLMLDNGEVWVIATNFNPCIVVDIWKLSEAGALHSNVQYNPNVPLTHIIVLLGKFEKTAAI